MELGFKRLRRYSEQSNGLSPTATCLVFLPMAAWAVDSVLQGNSHAGFSIVSGAASTFSVLTRVLVLNNGTGIKSSGPRAQIRVGQSEITGNGTGVSGTVLSYGTNQFNGNGAEGAITAISAPGLK